MVDKLISVALAEEGYLEKASNKDLDSKTANAGRNNYTKYARDLDNIKDYFNGKKQGYAWCSVFVSWCFVQAFGVDKAKKLLCLPDKSLAAGVGYAADYFKAKGQFNKTAKIGSQIFFGTSHTGIVYDIDDTYVYTIEGNTSSDDGVIANGGAVVKKKYKLNYNKISGYGHPKYEAEPKKDMKTVNIELPVLKKGEKQSEVKTVQRLLKSLGYKDANGNTLEVDGSFGGKTLYAVESFQKKNGLTVDGSVGRNTWTKLLEG